MTTPTLRTWLSGMLLGVALAFAVVQQSSSGPLACDPWQPGNPCSQSANYVLVNAGLNPAGRDPGTRPLCS